MGKLLIVGTMAFDAIETPFGKTGRILGGAGTFIGLAASQFDIDSAIVSVVGDDFPQSYMDILKNKDIDLSGVEVVKGGKTFFWEGKYHNDLNSRDTLATELNTLADFNPIVPDNYTDADIVMLGNLHPNIQLSVINQMEKRPKLIVLDTMNFWMDNTWDDLMKVISKIDVITINDEEARQLTNEYSLVKAAAKIQEMGPKYVVIKKGEHGALLFHKEQIFFAPALPLEEVFDPTGAGDTFAGGFAGYLTEAGNISFESMKNAIIHGSNLASFCVERFGTERMVDLKKSEVDGRLAQFKELTQFNIELT
ncbi:MAG: bifunctional hydroxymethylpyrimidine kinase/phosphomethylpyrimidine kinase [Muricauda sp.]|jgi:sugar/nucleoside kinase (ribokinase family)|uniref:PfkB family carbohydrate kinase n=1 Tax=Flagellimonas sp. TaxID=2058762 RepID=UPI001B15DA53|nr:PfkB family carbohydrate kinase [Allomuricauda sp.]MBO6533870.1 bifunctional hydroxymethylpyrimidine kinase/phosphomethylpyrimidine kinase [Allomuricauda sp.]MBO6587896.1 bifunctional hydroxymethylpyrimidine kinase/phosphomethylpyrimidine kinase [Allomuricauda sp.]MBO6617521.1 bifunctional hydroxymethylpyrimidine kinase/phosphomethylpyrimidine kinase [Allomuricauda sp.]MBO6643468.1 bifunctional hydroxymethylpyrimidine kinase/phosphomethylpyrimidine kinase [Allomuricauda sp.]MBO6745856.1 bif